MDDNLYAYVMRGELTKVALEKTPIVSKHSSSEMLAQEYVECLALDLLDDEKVNAAKLMQIAEKKRRKKYDGIHLVVIP